MGRDMAHMVSAFPAIMGTGMSDITEVVRIIFERAAKARASDVHIEPNSEAIRIRFRIDGTLMDQGTIALSDLEQIMTRLKVLAALDITAKPIPQDGHFEVDLSTFNVEQALPESPTQEKKPLELGMIKKERRVVDVRISIFPTVNGEAAVCRLLNRSETLFRLDDLGLEPKDLSKVRNLISKNYGMALVTGPTGAGKTTTLYSILEETVGQDRCAVTLEDPVEFRFETVRQTQVQPERGLTFAVGMKSILRQDPDIIMIGEIRDQETAEHAVRASLVGRIVFSTIHSNTTIGTVARLIDMNIEHSLIAYALNGVMSTRLVKKNCPSCKIEYEPSIEYLREFGLEQGQQRFWRGKGCAVCQGTGYSGRTGIFEVLELDNTFRAMIIDRASMADLEAYAVKNGMRTLKEDGLQKVLAGATSLENVAHAV